MSKKKPDRFRKVYDKKANQIFEFASEDEELTYITTHTLKRWKRKASKHKGICFNKKCYTCVLVRDIVEVLRGQEMGM